MRSTAATAFILVCCLLAGALVVRLLLPFGKPLVWASVLVAVFYPLFQWLVRRLGGRRRLASVVACVVIAGLFVVPVALLTLALARESSDAYVAIRDQLESSNVSALLRERVAPFAQHVSRLTGGQLQLSDRPESILVSGVGTVASFLMTNTRALLSGFANLVFAFLILVIAMYFFFVDGEGFVEWMRRLTPLTAAQENRVLRLFVRIGVATLYGSFLTALAQGVAAGIMFAVLGLPSSLLWGSAIAAASFIPLLGTALVWVPAATYFVLIGSTGKAIVLAVYSMAVVGTIDNIIKPLLLRDQMRMHTLLVFLSILGGLKLFGFIGLFLGPLAVALFETFVQLLYDEEELVAERSIVPAGEIVGVASSGPLDR